MTAVYAHRGASRAEQENTLAAFERAIVMGADAIELDVRRTIDDQLVIHHDAALDDGRSVARTAAADLPPHIPRFDDALDVCRDVTVHIEIKNPRRGPEADRSEWIAHAVASLLERRADPGGRCLSSFRFATIDRCRALLPGVRTAWCTTTCTEEQIGRAAAAGHAGIHPRVDHVDSPTIAASHRAGLEISPWTCDDPQQMRTLMSWGVDGIYTNVPDVAIDVRSSLAGS